jgi:hypothetical protein
MSSSPKFLNTPAAKELAEKMRKFSGRLTSSEMSEFFGVSVSTIKRRAKIIDVTFYTGSNLSYKPHEDQYIHKHYQTMSYQDIGNHLKRHSSSISARVTALGLSKKGNTKPKQFAPLWEIEDIVTVLIMHKQGYDDHFIANKLERTFEAVRYRIKHVKKILASDSLQHSRMKRTILIELRKRGSSLTEIADFMSVRILSPKKM